MSRRNVSGPLVLILLIAGCEGAGVDRRGESGTAEYPAMQPGDRPAERLIPVEIEGFEEELRFVLYRTPAGYPLPFSTYIPVDMVAETVSGGEGEMRIRFVAAFGGLPDEGAAVHVIAHGAGGTEAEAIAVLRQLAAALGTELVEAPADEAFEWSVRDFRSVALPSRPDAVEGSMAVGRRGDRYFSVVTHYPAEYGDGFGPRSRQILGEWRWEDTGEPLQGPAQGFNGRR
jgi:hypothetical protein